MIWGVLYLIVGVLWTLLVVPFAYRVQGYGKGEKEWGASENFATVVTLLTWPIGLTYSVVCSIREASK